MCESNLITIIFLLYHFFPYFNIVFEFFPCNIFLHFIFWIWWLELQGNYKFFSYFCFLINSTLRIWSDQLEVKPYHQVLRPQTCAISTVFIFVEVSQYTRKPTLFCYKRNSYPFYGWVRAVVTLSKRYVFLKWQELQIFCYNLIEF